METKCCFKIESKRIGKATLFQGGHVEMGESFVDAVIHEMKEETGLDIKNPRLAGVKQFPVRDGKYENGRYIVFLFKTNEFTGDIISSDEGKMEWVEISKMSELETVDDLEELLEVINNPELTEFQYLVEGDNWMVSVK
ncbi:8-oxo-dGTP diphosphatase [Butyrivibrio proteoclasticus]|uniref:8-oxo-dGTP diphosphatase n=1 Tax=Butyrivibrio proteoclasticus TaxID=43305 RepID=UPI001FA7DB30|nr:NUDIX domain-containing protein [Butyrivibrio proteoclasticus]